MNVVTELNLFLNQKHHELHGLGHINPLIKDIHIYNTHTGSVIQFSGSDDFLSMLDFQS